MFLVVNYVYHTRIFPTPEQMNTLGQLWGAGIKLAYFYFTFVLFYFRFITFMLLSLQLLTIYLKKYKIDYEASKD